MGYISVIMKKRITFEQIFAQHQQRKISVIIGSRQVGKTTILKALQQKLGGIFLDLDIYSNFEKVSSYENFLNTLKLEGYQENQQSFFYVFLDEFQRYQDISRVFKNIYDHHSNIKIFATGSSSLTIKNQLKESLAGRKIITHLYPLNFEEFLIFQDRPDLIQKIHNLQQIKSANYFSLIPEVASLLEEFLIFGGYPEVVLQKDLEAKKEVFESIFDLYIKKDLVDYLRIEKISQAKALIEYLAVNNGQIVNYTNLANFTKLDFKTVKSYLHILEETFLIKILRPFYHNKNKEISKSPKIYFVDNGVRNHFLNNFNHLNLRADSGELFEGYYIAEILKKGEKPSNIKYYRTKDQQEVDLVIDRVSELLPIELKFKKSKIKVRDLSGLVNFTKDYQVANSYLVNLQETGLIKKCTMLIDCFNHYF
jgi:predicted AAA+ superfamily ATPase